MDWSQISIGAIGGFVGKALLDFSKSGFDHFLEERKLRAVEQRALLAEQRQHDRKDAEKNSAAAEKLERDRAELIAFVTKLNGCTDFVSAARVVGEIHHFFSRYPLHLNQQNRAFLVEYPVDLIERAAYDVREDDDTTALDELKRKSMLLENTI
jgi:hypothetical protein